MDRRELTLIKEKLTIEAANDVAEKAAAESRFRRGQCLVLDENCQNQPRGMEAWRQV